MEGAKLKSFVHMASVSDDQANMVADTYQGFWNALLEIRHWNLAPANKNNQIMTVGIFPPKLSEECVETEYFTSWDLMAKKMALAWKHFSTPPAVITKGFVGVRLNELQNLYKHSKKDDTHIKKHFLDRLAKGKLDDCKFMSEWQLNLLMKLVELGGTSSQEFGEEANLWSTAAKVLGVQRSNPNLRKYINKKLLENSVVLGRFIDLCEDAVVNVHTAVDKSQLVIDKKPIAIGASGVVHRGTVTGMEGVDVAVKFLNESNISFDWGDFRREIAATSLLRHENIVVTLGASIVGDSLFIVQELVHKGSLRNLIHKDKWEIPQELLVSIIRDIASGIAFLHSVNIVHRDIKTDNILINNNNTAKITDFGTARTIYDGFLYEPIGTPQYMAPELLTRAGYDTSADIYSFGVILWELWVKKVPWHHVNSIYIIDRLGKGERPIPKPKKCPDFYSSLIKSS
eukprot:CAMPEP_0168509394 /NCGR_PEP_ID=MMETSP0405-20121227/745_1 /TAXON_ID=498012 /ORGANISM="Trichosphaerium sp, Strain Am-I-7 wt" /LENGTH=456 /DNA_ID=CAMNT_0008526835 /DNA_START=40 /DNA_END=1406 /DNA_ORIENTATION=+